LHLMHSLPLWQHDPWASSLLFQPLVSIHSFDPLFYQ
jgi:hypothetical protein